LKATTFAGELNDMKDGFLLAITAADEASSAMTTACLDMMCGPLPPNPTP
jgi:hypothetical protein